MNYKAITSRVWHLEEDYRDYCTLVRGDKLAILWDTGQGKQDLRAFLEEILDTPRAKAIYDGFSQSKAAEELCRKCGYAHRFR